jgi:glutamate-ammonia-ligase adenylyltransferase
MKNPAWSKALKSCADPQRARHHLDLLSATSAGPLLDRATAELARVLCALFSGSQALSEWLGAHPAELSVITIERLVHPRRKQGFLREVDRWLPPLLQAGDYTKAYAHLRQFKQREMLRIGTRDLARLARFSEIIQELSDVADVCLSSVWQLCNHQLRARLGQPRQQDAQGRWQPAPFCVFGMGKLGGQELNYSSDVDVIFVYGDEGRVFKRTMGRAKAEGGVSNHQFFNRLGEMLIAEVGRMTGAGTLYRIDLRLRPEGDCGPLTRSLSSYENYYAQWGQTWERMMLIKARCVAGDERLGADFLEMIQPFRYPRSHGEGVLREVAAMKDRIESEVVKAGELERNVKLGRGGIREIEFIAQTLQLINAGVLPFLQGAQTLPALEKLSRYDLLPRANARALAEAYVFLRDVEHRLQMEDNLQTHSIPIERAARERLAALMGFPTPGKFESALKRHTSRVRRIYDRLLKADTTAPPSEFPGQFEGAGERMEGNSGGAWLQEWRSIVAAVERIHQRTGLCSYKQPDVGTGGKIIVQIFCALSGWRFFTFRRFLAASVARPLRSRPGVDAVGQLHNRVRRARDAV